VDKKILESKLAALMDDIPEIEGLIALDSKGKIIVGQTITEMDLDAIAKAAKTAFDACVGLGGAVGKGSVVSLNVALEKGSSCIVGNDKVIIVTLQGLDASTSIALIVRQMKSILT
jgi:predicted regulator of Ras-like GTPase activity (Roadblock/LC7/MglB family)